VTTPAVRLRGAGIRFADRELWGDLDIDVVPGEFLAVLGPNGSGKTTLLKVLLGLQELSSGTAEVGGRRPHLGSHLVGYVPQQKAFDRDLPIRGRDLVRLGLDGHRWLIGLPNAAVRHRVHEAIEAVGATAYADAPIGLLSGGEQQRLRLAQALVGDPEVLLCDEPLLSLDLRRQQEAVELIDQRRRANDTAVLFVTHEINPILPFVDRVLYLVGNRWALGTLDEVLTGERLSQLFGAPIDVVRVGGRVVIAGMPDEAHGEHGAAHHHHAADDDHEPPAGRWRPWA
jgi:zinc/manganese transport system ATP-binding protein